MKKNVKLLALVLIISILSSVLIISLSACDKTDETLVVYNWEDYIDIGDKEADIQGVIEEFEEYYEKTTGKSIKVRYETFDTNESMLSKVLDTGYEVDLICPSEYAIERLIDAEVLQKFEKGSNSTNNINPIFKEKLDANFGAEFYEYVVPYMWGTLGILYNAKEITEEQIKETGWGILWNDVDDTALKEKLSGKIYMKDSVRDAYAAATMYLKEQGNELAKDKTAQELINIAFKEDGTLTDQSGDVLDAAFAALVNQAKDGHLKGYEVDNGKDEMIAQTALVNLAWSGDAFYAIEEAEEKGVELAYYAPEVGGNLWFDAWVMTAGCQNKPAAEMFVEFMCSPEIAMRNMMYIGYISAVDENVFMADADAMAILEDTGYDATEYFSDTNRYPTAEEYASLGVMHDFGEARGTIVTLWENVKASTNGNGNLMWIIFVAVAVAVVLGVVVFLAIKFRDKKKSKRKRAIRR